MKFIKEICHGMSQLNKKKKEKKKEGKQKPKKVDIVLEET